MFVVSASGANALTGGCVNHKMFLPWGLRDISLRRWLAVFVLTPESSKILRKSRLTESL